MEHHGKTRGMAWDAMNGVMALNVLISSRAWLLLRYPLQTKQRLSLTNVSWLLDNEDGTYKKKYLYTFLGCEVLSNDDVGLATARHCTSGDTDGNYFPNLGDIVKEKGVGEATVERLACRSRKRQKVKTRKVFLPRGRFASAVDVKRLLQNKLSSSNSSSLSTGP